MPSVTFDSDSLNYIKNSNLNFILSEEERKDLLEQFKLASSDKCRISIILTAAAKYHGFISTQSEENKNKNQSDSLKFKNEGNRIFLSKRDAEEYLKALELYNKSIAFAPNNSSQLALGFANRSAVLFHLRKYSEAVQDIDRALELNYPDNLKHKLLLRKTECLALLGSAELSEVYEETLKLMNDMSLDASNKEILKNKLTAAREVNKEEKQDDFDQDLPIIVSQNEIPAATNAVALKYNPKFGRHTVAARDIKPGEILAVEKPYALAPFIDKMYTHCAHCLKFAWTGIPCDSCVCVLYCSKNCKDLAWKAYHDIECPVTGELRNRIFCSTGFLCLRLVILAVREFGSIEKLKDELSKIDSYEEADPRTRGFSEDGKLHSNTYRSIYNLHTNAENRPIFYFFLRSLEAVLILYYMATCSAFFDKTFKSNDFTSLLENDNAVFIGGLILRHFQIIATNLYPYQEQCISKYRNCGLMIMSFVSFINHSCIPNVCRTVSKGHFVLYAMRPIKKDTQIFFDYGLPYWDVTKKERQLRLTKEFFITCECDPCEQNWPTLSKMTNVPIKSLKSDSAKRKVINALTQLKDYTNLLNNAKTVTDKCKVIKSKPNIVKDLENIVQVLIQYLPLNSLECYCAMNTLKQVVTAFGNRFEVPKLKEI